MNIQTTLVLKTSLTFEKDGKKKNYNSDEIRIEKKGPRSKVVELKFFESERCKINIRTLHIKLVDIADDEIELTILNDKSPDEQMLKIEVMNTLFSSKTEKEGMKKLKKFFTGLENFLDKTLRGFIIGEIPCKEKKRKPERDENDEYEPPKKKRKVDEEEKGKVQMKIEETPSFQSVSRKEYNDTLSPQVWKQYPRRSLRLAGRAPPKYDSSFFAENKYDLGQNEFMSGVTNLGNTCYISAIINTLRHLQNTFIRDIRSLASFLDNAFLTDKPLLRTKVKGDSNNVENTTIRPPPPTNWSIPIFFREFLECMLQDKDTPPRTKKRKRNRRKRTKVKDGETEEPSEEHPKKRLVQTKLDFKKKDKVEEEEEEFDPISSETFSNGKESSVTNLIVPPPQPVEKENVKQVVDDDDSGDQLKEITPPPPPTQRKTRNQIEEESEEDEDGSPQRTQKNTQKKRKVTTPYRSKKKTKKIVRKVTPRKYTQSTAIRKLDVVEKNDVMKDEEEDEENERDEDEDDDDDESLIVKITRTKKIQRKVVYDDDDDDNNNSSKKKEEEEEGDDEEVIIDPTELKKLAGQHNDIFSGGRQQDSHEFLLTCFHLFKRDIEDMKKAVLPNIQSVLLRNPNHFSFIPNVPQQQQMDSIGRLFHPVENNFGGKMERRYVCTSCKRFSCVVNDFDLLSLPIPSSEVKGSDKKKKKEKANLDLVLRNFFSMYTVSRKCGFCGVNGTSNVMTRIQKVPSVLILHLKRFLPVYNRESGSYSQKKLHTVVKLQNSVSLRDFCVNQPQGTTNQDIRYDINSFIIHEGRNTKKGHYLCFTKNVEKDWWYKINDDVSENNISEKKVFMERNEKRVYIITLKRHQQ